MRTLLILLLVVLPGTASAGPPTDEERIERLASLGRLWGVVKHFHPHLLVEPTIEGIIAGRDEILEAALELLAGTVAAHESP